MTHENKGKNKSRNENELEITRSSGNVFQDLACKNAGEHYLKAKFALLINQLIQERNLTQVDAAKLLGVDQPKISRLTRGQLTGFSIDKLIAFLISLGQEIEVNVRPHLIKNKQVKLHYFLH